MFSTVEWITVTSMHWRKYSTIKRCKGIHRTTWAKLKYYKWKKQIQRVYILWSIHVTFWKRENYGDINGVDRLFDGKVINYKEVHREASQGKKLFCVVLEWWIHLFETHKTVNHKKGNTNYASLKKNRSIPGQNPDCDKWTCNSVADEWHNCTNMGTEGERSILSFGKLYFTRN